MAKKFNPSFAKELSIESIISAPLVAASKANVVMMTGQTRFLLEYCFTKDKDSYKPVMVDMVFHRNTIDPEDKDKGAKETQLSFSIPLLCLVPINSLGIDKVTLDFDLEITSTTSRESKTANGSDNKVINKTAKLQGKISYDHDERSANPQNSQYKSQSSSKLKVNINASQLPLPVGVLTLIDLYSKSIQPSLPDKSSNT